MHLPRATLLAAVTASLPFTVALPSYSEYVPQQHTQHGPRLARPFWRTVSDKVIEKIWALDSNEHKTGLAQHISPWVANLRRDGDILLRFNVTTSEEVEALADVANYMYLDVWETTGDWVDLRMAEERLPHVLRVLPESLRHSHTALLREKELARAIFDTYPSPHNTALPSQPGHLDRNRMFTPSLQPSSLSGAESNVFFHDYQPLSVMQPWLRLLASLFTTHVRLIKIGTSFEGRDIPALRVGVHPTNDEKPSAPRRTVLITAGSHAREWISTSTVNYIAYSLVTSYGKDNAITSLLENFDFVFVPTINPDGYAYTWESDRLWRKTRQSTSARFCYGVDLDRSYSYHFDPSATTGNPCSESFSGTEAFEAVEAQALARWARNETENNNVEFVGYLDLHAYSQQILYPYSYTCDIEPPNLENLEELAAGLAKAIRMSHGHVFEAKPACEGNVGLSSSQKQQKQILPRFESAGGSALDWFYHEMKVHFAYQIKLRDRGSYGFLLPREHIIPSGKEMLEAVTYFGKHLEEVFGMNEGGQVVLGGEVVDDQLPAEEGDWEEHDDEQYTELKRRRKG